MAGATVLHEESESYSMDNLQILSHALHVKLELYSMHNYYM